MPKTARRKVSLPKLDPKNVFTAQLPHWGAHLPPEWVIDPVSLREIFDSRVIKNILKNRLDALAKIADINARALKREAQLMGK